MTKLLFASLLFTTACFTGTSSKPGTTTVPPPAPPKVGVCVVGQIDDQLLVLSRKSDVAGLPTSDLTISSTGAWRFDQRDGQGQVTTTTGCLAAADLAALRDALRTATWKTTAAPEPRCMANPADWTQYMVNGKVVYSYRLCDGKVPDVATSNALGVIAGLVTKIQSTPVAEPCPVCLETKDALLQVDVDGIPSVPKSHLLIDDSGAWQLATTDQAGAKTRAGQLTADQLARLKSAIASATWHVDHAKYRCMAEAMTWSTYAVHGKPVYSAKLCDGKIPDESTRKAVTEIDAIVAAL